MARVPPSTAEVIEFRCQYTHNIVQKRKKWNDGSLKFHTFNKLVRIFDEDNNHVGQKHWQGGEPLQDGDEFQLDNMLVCVQDLLRSTQTNVAPLFEKRQKSALGQRLESPKALGLQAPSFQHSISGRAFEPSASSTGARSQHKSLSALLGMNKGAIGKAVAPRSPFETRHISGHEADDYQSPSKRCRIDISGDEPWIVTNTTKPKKSRLVQPQPSATALTGNSKTVKRKSAQAKTSVGQKTLKVKSVIDLTTESSPARNQQSISSAQNVVSNDNPADRSEVAEASSPAFTSPIPQAVDHASRNISRTRDNDQRINRSTHLEAIESSARLNERPFGGSAGNRRKQLILSCTKRKSSLICVQASAGALATGSRSTNQVRFDLETANNGHQGRRQTSSTDRNLNEERVTLRDVFQGSNMMHTEKSASDNLSRSAKSSPTKTTFARSQSDPTALMTGVGDSRVPTTHTKQCNRPAGKRALKRAQTLGAAPAEFKIPDSIFSQLPPEIDRDKTDLGPWSREALDLFDWRPPDWEQRLASRPLMLAMVD